MTEPAKKSNGRAWRGRPVGAAAEGAAASTRRRNIVILAAVILLIAGAIIALLLSIQPIKEPYFVGLWIYQIDDPLIPINPWAAADRQVIQDMGWPEKNAFSRQERKLLLQELEGLEPRVDRPLAVYLSIHAVVDQSGEVFVLPGNAKLAEPSTWIRLEGVLGSMRDCKAGHKLLILDLCQPFAEPRLGLLRTDVMDRAQPLIERSVEEDPHLLVLTSCSPGQSPHVLEDMGRTAFGYYLEQGLNGAADGYNDKQRRDSRISVQELAAFVTARVDRWSRKNRLEAQTPRLSGKDDFILIRSHGGTRLEEPPEAMKYPEWFVRDWDLLEEWRANPEYRTSVKAYRRLESALLGAERRYRGGLDADKPPTDLTDPLSDFERERNQRRQEVDAAPPRSLAEALRRVRKAREEAAKAKDVPKDAAKPSPSVPADLDDKLRALEELHAKIKAIEKRDEKEEARLTVDRDAILKSCEGFAVDLAHAIFERIGETSRPRLDQVQLWNELIIQAWRRTPERTPPHFDQFDMLTRLAQVSKEYWQSEAARLAFRAAREKAETAGCDSKTLAWVRDSLTAAAAAQQTAEQLIIDGEAEARAGAAKRFDEAYQGYSRANRQIRIVQAAKHRSEEAMARLPGLGVHVEQDSGKLRDWQATAQAAKRLRKLLETPPAREGPKLANALRELEDATTPVENGLNRLTPRLDRERLRGMMDQAVRLSIPSWAELNALLSGPGPDAIPRKEVWDASRRLSGRLFQQTLTEDNRDDDAHQPTPAPGVSAKSQGEAAARAHAVARARLSAALLDLDDLANTKELLDAIDRAEAGDAKALEDVSQRLKAAWQDHLTAPR